MPEPPPPPPPRGEPAPEWESVTHRFVVGGLKGYVIAAPARGTPVYIEILMAKEGGTLRGLLDALSACVCIGLERGVPLSAYINAMEHARFEPSGHTPRGFAHSIVDYVFRWLRDRYPEPEPDLVIAPEPVEGPTCGVCGMPVIWTAGDACPECGHVD